VFRREPHVPHVSRETVLQGHAPRRRRVGRGAITSFHTVGKRLTCQTQERYEQQDQEVFAEAFDMALEEFSDLVEDEEDEWLRNFYSDTTLDHLEEIERKFNDLRASGVQVDDSEILNDELYTVITQYFPDYYDEPRCSVFGLQPKLPFAYANSALTTLALLRRWHDLNIFVSKHRPPKVARQRRLGIPWVDQSPMLKRLERECIS